MANFKISDITLESQIAGTDLLEKETAGGTSKRFEASYMTDQMSASLAGTSGTDFAISDAGSGEIDVAAGTAYLRASDTQTGAILKFSFAGQSGISLTDQNTNWVYLDYNAGTPQVATTTTFSTIDLNTQAIIGRVYRDGTTLHIYEVGQYFSNYNTLDCKKDFEVDGIERASGLVLGETGTRNITVSAGVIYCAHNRTTTSAIDTSGADTFDVFNSGASTSPDTTGVSQVDNTQYWNGAALANLTNNRYGTRFFFMDHEGDVYMVYGTSNTTDVATAENEAIPTLNTFLNDFAIYIGRVVIEKGASSFELTTNPFLTVESGVIVTDHGDLAGLADDDHSQYALLTGRSGGQTIYGGTDASDNLTLDSTSDSTEGLIIVNSDLRTDRFLGGGDNTFIGEGVAGTGLTHSIGVEGWQNTFVGDSIGTGITSGYRNTALGQSIYNSLTTGYSNIAIGSGVMGALTSGHQNTAIGRTALATVTTGKENTGIGVGAGLNTTGDSNTLIGFLAGDNITSGSNNIIIGSDINADSETANSQINIGNVYKATSTEILLTKNTFINDTANTNSTIGLTINQGANDDEILTLKSSDVNQPATTSTEADTFGLFKKNNATNGGLLINGYSDGDNVGIKINGIMGASDPTDTTGAIVFAGYKSDGSTGVTALADDETVFQVKNSTTELMTILGDGSVGIGVTDPGFKLEVVGNSNLVASRIVAPSGTAGNVRNVLALKGLATVDMNDGFGAQILFQIEDTAASNNNIGVLGYRRAGADNTSEFFIKTANSGSLSEALTIDEDGNVGIGTTSPDSLLHIEADQDTTEYLYLEGHDNDTASTRPVFKFLRSRGSQSSPSIVSDDDNVGTILASGYDGSGYHILGSIEFNVDGTPSDGTDMPGRITFWTAPDGSSTRQERVRIDNAGNVGIGTTDPNETLHIYDDGGSTNADLKLEDSVNDARIFFSAGATYTGGKIEYKSATGDMEFTADSDIVMNSSVFIGDTANTEMTQGLTINQGANDDEILSLKSSDVAHGDTSTTETDTFGKFGKSDSAAGGLSVVGYRDSDGGAGDALILKGFLDENANTNKTTSASGVIRMIATITDGSTGETTVNSDGNLMVIGNYNTTRFIFDAEGSAHADVEWTTFDSENDVALLDAMTHEFESRKSDPVKAEYGKFMNEHKQLLQEHKIVNFYDDGPRAMVNTTRLQMLLTGAVRQLARKVEKYELAFKQLGVDTNNLLTT
jgi:hypothetical protein